MESPSTGSLIPQVPKLQSSESAENDEAQIPAVATPENREKSSEASGMTSGRATPQRYESAADVAAKESESQQGRLSSHSSSSDDTNSQQSDYGSEMDEEDECTEPVNNPSAPSSVNTSPTEQSVGNRSQKDNVGGVKSPTALSKQSGLGKGLGKEMPDRDTTMRGDPSPSDTEDKADDSGDEEEDILPKGRRSRQPPSALPRRAGDDPSPWTPPTQPRSDRIPQNQFVSGTRHSQRQRRQTDWYAPSQSPGGGTARRSARTVRPPDRFGSSRRSGSNSDDPFEDSDNEDGDSGDKDTSDGSYGEETESRNRRSGRLNAIPPRRGQFCSDDEEDGTGGGSSSSEGFGDSDEDFGETTSRRLKKAGRSKQTGGRGQRRKSRRSGSTAKSYGARNQRVVTASRQQPTRQSTRLVNYAELDKTFETDDEDKEADQKQQEYLQSIESEPDSVFGIDRVLNHKVEVNPETGASEKLFLLKWRGKSFLHCTWERHAVLLDQQVMGLRRVENYLRRHEELEESKKWKTEDEIEQEQITVELQKELDNDAHICERVIDCGLQEVEDDEDADDEEIDENDQVSQEDAGVPGDTTEHTDALAPADGLARSDAAPTQPTQIGKIEQCNVDKDEEVLDAPNTIEKPARKAQKRTQEVFLIKWLSTPYDQCTWETRDTLVEHGFQAKIDEFYLREEFCRGRVAQKRLGVSNSSRGGLRIPPLLSTTSFEPYRSTPYFLMKACDVLTKETKKRADSCEMNESEQTSQVKTETPTVDPAQETIGNRGDMKDEMKHEGEAKEENDAVKTEKGDSQKTPEAKGSADHNDKKDNKDEPRSLRDYQLIGVNWMISRMKNDRSVLLADEMGLGKTLQTISVIGHCLFAENICGPFLVVVPQSTCDNWMREFAFWLPAANVVQFHGNAKARDLIRTVEMKKVRIGSTKRDRFRFDVCVTTPSIINSATDLDFLRSIQWYLLAVDEAHQLKNRESKRFKDLNSIPSFYRLLLSGTPLHNNLEEMWTLLHFMDPNRYESYTEFSKAYSEVERTDCVGETKRGQLVALQQELGQVVLRRVKKDVEKSMPKKIERLLRVELSPMQGAWYRNVLTRNYEELTRSSGGSKMSLNNIIMELKKICNHPYLLHRKINDPDDENYTPQRAKEMEADDQHGLLYGSGKTCLLDKLLQRLHSKGHRVLIFSQMVRMLNLLSQVLTSKGYKHQRLDGTMGKEIRKKAMDHFNAPDSDDFCFLLSTKAGGLGLNLTSADTVIIFDSDWNPQNDLQAEARAHRIGQTKTVNIYRLITKDSIEENILERAKAKMVLDTLVIQGLNKRSTSGDGVDNMEGNGDSSMFSGGGAGRQLTFNSDELAKILRFGANKLWSSDGESSATGGGQPKPVPSSLDADIDLDQVLQEAEKNADDDDEDDETGGGGDGGEKTEGGLADDLFGAFSNISDFRYEAPDVVRSHDSTSGAPAVEGSGSGGRSKKSLSRRERAMLMAKEDEALMSKDFWDKTIPLEDRMRIQEAKENQLIVKGPRNRRQVGQPSGSGHGSDAGPSPASSEASQNELKKMTKRERDAANKRASRDAARRRAHGESTPARKGGLSGSRSKGGSAQVSPGQRSGGSRRCDRGQGRDPDATDSPPIPTRHGQRSSNRHRGADDEEMSDDGAGEGGGRASRDRSRRAANRADRAAAMATQKPSRDLARAVDESCGGDASGKVGKPLPTSLPAKDVFSLYRAILKFGSPSLRLADILLAMGLTSLPTGRSTAGTSTPPDRGDENDQRHNEEGGGSKPEQGTVAATPIGRLVAKEAEQMTLKARVYLQAKGHGKGLSRAKGLALGAVQDQLDEVTSGAVSANSTNVYFNVGTGTGNAGEMIRRIKGLSALDYLISTQNSLDRFNKANLAHHRAINLRRKTGGDVSGGNVEGCEKSRDDSQPIEGGGVGNDPPGEDKDNRDPSPSNSAQGEEDKKVLNANRIGKLKSKKDQNGPGPVLLTSLDGGIDLKPWDLPTGPLQLPHEHPYFNEAHARLFGEDGKKGLDGDAIQPPFLRLDLPCSVTNKLKPPLWAPPDWGDKDDADLLKGLYRYGFGNWPLIAQDENLNMECVESQKPEKVKQRALRLLQNIERMYETSSGGGFMDDVDLESIGDESLKDILNFGAAPQTGTGKAVSVRARPRRAPASPSNDDAGVPRRKGGVGEDDGEGEGDDDYDVDGRKESRRRGAEVHSSRASGDARKRENEEAACAKDDAVPKRRRTSDDGTGSLSNSARPVSINDYDAHEMIEIDSLLPLQLKQLSRSILEPWIDQLQGLCDMIQGSPAKSGSDTNQGEDDVGGVTGTSGEDNRKRDEKERKQNETVKTIERLILEIGQEIQRQCGRCAERSDGNVGADQDQRGKQGRRRLEKCLWKIVSEYTVDKDPKQIQAVYESLKRARAAKETGANPEDGKVGPPQADEARSHKGPGDQEAPRSPDVSGKRGRGDDGDEAMMDEERRGKLEANKRAREAPMDQKEDETMDMDTTDR
eukprot:GHVN01068522.1.p1 GENE.GHVN01068522.1~~GHVN01068522.1.p1  ORF type:complete len:2493 (+),score=491.04 GHVN01068522.1:367-7845(+)